MKKLITNANLPDPDGFYARLLELHDGHDKPASDAINARLILLLANHIGDDEILKEALDLASQSDTSGKNR